MKLLLLLFTFNKTPMYCEKAQQMTITEWGEFVMRPIC